MRKPLRIPGFSAKPWRKKAQAKKEVEQKYEAICLASSLTLTAEDRETVEQQRTKLAPHFLRALGGPRDLTSVKL